jgi:zinc protease
MGPGWFAVTAIPTPGVTPEALETAIDGVLAGIPTHRFTREELKRTQTLFLAESIYARDSLQGLGMVVGELRTAGLPLSYLDAWEARIRDVTTDDMQKAAASVLIPEVSVTGLMLPEGSAK